MPLLNLTLTLTSICSFAPITLWFPFPHFFSVRLSLSVCLSVSLSHVRTCTSSYRRDLQGSIAHRCHSLHCPIFNTSLASLCRIIFSWRRRSSVESSCFFSLHYTHFAAKGFSHCLPSTKCCYMKISLYFYLIISLLSNVVNHFETTYILFDAKLV